MDSLGIVFLILAVVVYFAPALTAHSRQHHQRGAILVLNLLAGWTIVGWLIAAVWASSRVQPPAPPSDWEKRYGGAQ